MSDLISRQAAVKNLTDEYHGMISDESMKIYQIIDWLNSLPSAEKTGRWIYINGNYYGQKCGACGYAVVNSTNYCPNCGSRMIESEGKEC